MRSPSNQRMSEGYFCSNLDCSVRPASAAQGLSLLTVPFAPLNLRR